MLRPTPPPPVHRAIAALLATVVLTASLPARAETEAEEGRRKIGYLTLGMTGLAVVGGVWAGVSLARANSYYDDRRELSFAMGGTGNLGANDVGCRTPEECERKTTLREGHRDAVNQFYLAVSLTSVVAAFAIAGGVYWFASAPAKDKASSRFVPSAGPTGAGLRWEATF